jgi:hypothetical protein
MTEVEQNFSPPMKVQRTVSILDESLFTGGHGPHKIFCSIDPGFISVAAVDAGRNKFSGFEGFHFAKPLSDEQLALKVTGLAHESAILKKVDFRNVSVQFANERFTLIPSAIFKAEDVQSYFYFNQVKREDDSIHVDHVMGFDAVNIFAVSDTLISAVRKLFERFTIHHHLSALLNAARLYPHQQGGKNIFIHVHSSSMDVIVVEERKLLLANTFPFTTVEDGIYFVMMIFSRLSLNAESTELTVAGEIEKGSPLTAQLQKYIRHVSFGQRNKATGFTYGFDELPPHFYHAAFSHILCES